MYDNDSDNGDLCDSCGANPASTTGSTGLRYCDGCGAWAMSGRTDPPRGDGDDEGRAGAR